MIPQPSTEPDHTLGIVRREPDGTWRWLCGDCPGQSVGTYPTDDDAWQALRRHLQASLVVHR